MAKSCYRYYDWAGIQRYYDEGNGYLRCREKFGFAKDSWIKAIRCGRIPGAAKTVPSSTHSPRFQKPLHGQASLTREPGLLRNACEECGLAEWRGRPLTIQIDHRKGVNDDHRLQQPPDAVPQLP